MYEALSAAGKTAGSIDGVSLSPGRHRRCCAVEAVNLRIHKQIYEPVHTRFRFKLLCCFLGAIILATSLITPYISATFLVERMYFKSDLVPKRIRRCQWMLLCLAKVRHHVQSGSARWGGNGSVV